ncbi:DUF433 domain-containing protein [Limnospira sp. Paracas R14]|uniref:DUF433 domain-containing protein n=1 Tax=Limnospira sp. Paracas R14 TaxID=2981108 RepID=UPI0028E1329F|nr:DUF433 domain-containing protein [Limnospira sp. Paracas R14]
MNTNSDIFMRQPGILGGTPVFTGTRVPVSTLMDYLEGGDSIDLFLYDFPSVRREQVIAFLEYAKRGALEAVPA